MSILIAMGLATVCFLVPVLFAKLYIYFMDKNPTISFVILVLPFWAALAFMFYKCITGGIL